MTQAGTAVMRYFEKVGVKCTKTDNSDVVTEADIASSKIIVESIKKHFPDHGIIDEESGVHENQSEYIWYSDPLDGTYNFVHKTPLFGIMLCLVKNNVPEAAGIFEPSHQQLIYAERNKGAFLNGERIACSDTKDWLHSYGCASARLVPQKTTFLKNLIEESSKGPFWVSVLGSTAISSMYVASGKRDWYFTAGNKIWDYAPTALILKESGCVVTNINGENWSIGDKEIIAANKYLHPKLLKIAK